MNVLKLILSLIIVLFSFFVSANAKTTTNFAAFNNPIDTIKMKVEVWSDVMCPFCYIGKKKFESALEKFSGKKNIELTWKSYQLDPSIKNGETPDYKEYLSKRKGMSLSHVTQMLQQVTEMAKGAGLTFHLDKAVIANSFDAHRLSHLALIQGKQNQVEELLFAAHFIEGKDISNHTILIEIAARAGIDSVLVKEMLDGKKFAKEVLADVNEAQQLGIQGVPFFVFNRKYAVSGAQPASSFLQVLEKSYAEWEKESPTSALKIINGPACTPNGECK